MKLLFVIELFKSLCINIAVIAIKNKIALSYKPSSMYPLKRKKSQTTLLDFIKIRYNYLAFLPLSVRTASGLLRIGLEKESIIKRIFTKKNSILIF
ncbi:MAG: hypothetical protein ACJAUH_002507 [Saprospiraceae bacterium]|jgi:hypothetical protein